MCGIAGLINPKGKDVAALDIRMMSNAIKHRGPDDLGFLGWRAGGDIRIDREAVSAVQGAEVAFAHRRLSIIDKSEGGWQPMATADGRYAITFNGEIYNYIELKSALETQGVKFTSDSDTEVLLSALALWGIETTLTKLTGMFAFAVLDTKAQTVTLARDPFGIKPLSYTTVQGGLAFASELTSLLMLSGVDRRVEPSALYDFLRFGFTDRGDRTLFASIKHLPAAHFAVVNLDAPNLIKVQRYWQPELKPVRDISFEAATAELRQLFLDSIRLHLRSDVPVGATLSGGIDSSAVVGVMRVLEGPDLDLHTFTFTAPGHDLDEENWADIAAKSVQANQHKISLKGENLVQDIDALIQIQGEPFSGTSVFAQYHVFKLAHDNGIKVTLDGQGADEILAGYVPFIAARLATLVKSGQWGRALKLLKSTQNRRGIFLRAMRFLLPMALQGVARSCVGESLVPAWMNGQWFQQQGVNIEAPQKPVSGDVLRHELLESLVDRVLPALLRFQDRNSMAYSVESRVPFLTTTLVDFLYSLPEDFLISDQGETKSIFRAAMREIVPDEILDRRDKIGFAAPEETWLNDSRDWLEGVLNRDTLSSIPAFDTAIIKRELQAVKMGEKPLTGEVWRWLILVRWGEIFDVDFGS